MDKSSSIRGLLIIALSIVLAIWLGVNIVTNQTETILQISAVSMLLLCIFLGRKIWLLLVFFTALNVPIIRGFSTAELGQALFIGFTTMILLMRRQPLKLRFGEMEIWMLLLVAVVVQTYLRNPVGLNIFGAGDVGARPYFLVALSFAASALLANIVVPPEQLRWALKLSILGSIAGVGLSALRLRGIDSRVAFEANARFDEGKEAGRIADLTSLGNCMARIVVSFRSPLKALLHPIWLPIILTTVAAATGSGYRNSVASVGLFFLVGIAYRGGIVSVLFSVISCTLGLVLLAVVNVASPLPPNVQRALSPFPGTWEKRHVQAAEASTEWRVDMWKEALTTDYWIHNKILGDGLGFTRKELEMIESTTTGGTGLTSMNSGMTQQQEAMMVTGGYHSGPVQCVRIVGYVGFVIVICGMIRIAVHGHQQIMRCRNTEWFPIALYTGIPAIVLPVFYVFVFGDFARDVSALFLFYGMISLLKKNLPLPEYKKTHRIPYVHGQTKIIHKPT
jgi:hypothetical protein